MCRWIAKNKILFSFFLVMPFVIGVILQDITNPPPAELLMYHPPTYQPAPSVSDCRSVNQPEQLIELPKYSGHAHISGGSGAGSLTFSEDNLPAGGLDLDTVPVSKPAVWTRRYMLEHSSHRSADHLLAGR